MVQRTSSSGMSVASNSKGSSSSRQSWYADVFGLGGTSAATVTTPKHRFSEPTRRNRSGGLEWEPTEPALLSDDDEDEADSPLLRAPPSPNDDTKDTSFDFGGLYTDDGCNLGGNFLCAPANGRDAILEDKDSLQKTIRLLEDQNSTLLARNQALEFESSALRQKQLELEFAASATTNNEESTIERSVDDTELTYLREELQQLTEILSKERKEFADFKAEMANESTSVLPYDVSILSEREKTIQELRQKCLEYSQELTDSADVYEREKHQWSEKMSASSAETESLQNELRVLQESYQSSVEELEGRLDEWQQRAMKAEQSSDINVRDIQTTLQASQRSMDVLKDEHEKSKEQHVMELSKWQTSANEWEATAQARLQEIDALQKDLETTRTALKDAQGEGEEANESVSHMVETVQQLETKYLKIENELFETKLKLEAQNEEMDALKDEHEAQIKEMEESIERILMEKSKLEEAQEEQTRMWEERLEAISEEQGEIAGERELRLSELGRQIEELVMEKDHLVEDHALELRELNLRLDSMVQENEQLQQKSRALPQLEEKKDDESYEGSNRINALIAEVDRLERALEDEQRSSESFLSNLRSEYQMVKDREMKLEDQIEEQKTEFERFTQELQDAITKRDERIEALLAGDRGHGEILALKAENAHLQTKLNESLPMDEAKNDQSIIIERDEAIASLVTQTQEQEEIINELQEQLKSLMINRSSRSVKSIGDSPPDVVKRLEEEAKVFAEQVIELDEEMEQLKVVLSERERQAIELSKQLMDVKNNRDDPRLSKLVKDLEAEVDELREANKTQLEEIRDLRKKVWTNRSHDDEITSLRNQLQRFEVEADDHKRSAKQANGSWGETQRLLAEERSKRDDIESTLTKKIESMKSSSTDRIQSLEQQLKDVQAEYDAFKASPSHVSEEEYKALQDELANLKQTVENLNFELDNSRRTVQELDGMLAEKRANEAAFHEEEKEELLAEMETLSSKLEEARHRISQMTEDETLIGDFKAKLERADDAREESEKNIIATYERKISLLTLDKDVMNDKLRKELIAEKEANAEEIAELNEQLKLHQNEVSELREELEEQIEQREARIFELEHTLEAQEQLVENMKSEMDHLQGSMEGNTARRKEEIEELQKELLDMTAASTKQEREIEALKGELEATKNSHDGEVAQLKQKLVDLEGAPEKNRNAQDLQMELRVKEVKDRLEKLKWRNNSLKVENINLRERLERAETILQENDQPEKLKSLQAELDAQARKIKKLETELERAREPPAATRTSGRSRSLSTTRSRQPPRKPTADYARTPPRSGNTITGTSKSSASVGAPSPARKGLFSRLRSRSKEPSVTNSPKTVAQEAS